MLPAALFLGAVAVSAGRNWIDREVARQVRNHEASAPEAAAAPPMATLVVAAQPLRYGAEVTRGSLKEMPWPAGELPAGAFAKIDQLFADKQRRLALAAVEPNEPLLATKITGPGQRANLAALLGEGMKAVTVRVDDVVGVGGFVLPGDMVDVILTREAGKGDAVSDVILQNLRVLAIDQIADAQTAKPAVARAVTLEVATDQAQRLAVARQVGALSLALRAAGERAEEAASRVRAADLVAGSSAPSSAPSPLAAALAAAAAAAPAAPGQLQATVGVIRGAARQEYTVPNVGADRVR